MWKNYLEQKTKLIVKFELKKEEIIYKKELKSILTDGQLSRITQIKVTENLLFMTKKARVRCNNYVKKFVHKNKEKKD